MSHEKAEFPAIHKHKEVRMQRSGFTEIQIFIILEEGDFSTL